VSGMPHNSSPDNDWGRFDRQPDSAWDWGVGRIGREDVSQEEHSKRNQFKRR